MASAYPGALDTALSLLTASNNRKTRLVGDITALTTDIAVAAVTGFQATDGIVSIDNEVVKYTSINTSGANPVLVSCSRGHDGTSAQPHYNDAAVELRWVAKHHNGLVDAILAVQTALGVDIEDTYDDLATRLLRNLPETLTFAAPTTDWSFVHQKRRCVIVQCWRLSGGVYIPVTPANMAQDIDPDGESTVTVTMPSAYEGYLVHI